jgi:hypothetical protein
MKDKRKMKKLFYDTIKNADGSRMEVVLNERESRVANYLQRVANALGYDVAITTLTSIAKKITEQKFYQVAPADFVPVRVGEGAWSDQIMTYRDFSMADSFETGIIQTGDDNSRLASADAGVDSIYVPVFNWAKQNSYNLIQLEQASKSGNWDIVAAKARSRKRNWDLGIQSVAFLGAKGLNSSSLPASKQCLGLLNQNLSSAYGAQVTVNTTLITAPLYSLAATPANLSSFLQQILGLYQANNSYTAMPTHFAIPTLDYLGLATASSPTFPLKSILEYMQETFKTMTGNQNFKILPVAYAVAANNPYGKNIYALYNYEEESIRMDIPVDFTNTMANTINNFQFQSVAYGQFTGVGVYRPQELMYFQY